MGGTAGPTRPEVVRRQDPMSSGPASQVSPGSGQAPCRVRPKAHAPIRRGTTTAEANVARGTSGSALVLPAAIGRRHDGMSPCTRTKRRGGQQTWKMRCVAISPHVRRCGLTVAVSAEPVGRDARPTPHAPVRGAGCFARGHVTRRRPAGPNSAASCKCSPTPHAPEAFARPAMPESRPVPNETMVRHAQGRSV